MRGGRIGRAQALHTGNWDFNSQSSENINLSWGSFNAVMLHSRLDFESLHICTDSKVNANANVMANDNAYKETLHYNSVELIR